MSINMNPVTHISLSGVHYPPTKSSTEDIISRDVDIVADGATELMAENLASYSAKIDELTRTNEVLQLVIKVIQSNPLMVNNYIVADDDVLIRIIQLLCNATEVNIDADDLGQGCITKNKYRKVQSIYVTTSAGIKNLKYDFPDVMKQLKDLNISTKFVY